MRLIAVLSQWQVVGKRHDKVKQSIERLAGGGTIGRPPMGDVEEIATTPTGGRRTRVTSVYHLEKRDSYVVVAQLSPEFTARLVDRWQELEAQSAKSTSLTGPRLMAAALIEADATMKAQAGQIAEMTPKVIEYDAYLSGEGVCRVSDFCNKHGVKVRHPGYIRRDKGMLHQKKLLATQTGLRTGLLKNVVNRDNFEYVDSKGRSVEAQSAHVVVAEENKLLEWIVDEYGQTAFRNKPQFIRAKSLIGGAA